MHDIKSIKYSNSDIKQIITSLILVIFIITVLWYTVLKRPRSYQIPQFELFWSYRKWLAGNISYRTEIIYNILMFMPFGFLLCDFSYNSLSEKFKRWCLIIILSAAFSLFIEILQCVMVRGLAEVDDLISNTAGAILGICVYESLNKLIDTKFFRYVCIIIEVSFSLICLCIYIAGRRSAPFHADNASQAFCFQIDDVSTEDNQLILSGFAFTYERKLTSPHIILRHTKTGEETELTVTYGIARPDVNSYFLCDYDYTNVGFKAIGNAVADEEYEIMIRWPWTMKTSAGVFVTGKDIHYFSYENAMRRESISFAMPKLTSDFATKGTLLLYRPDIDLWIYQYNGALYWVAGSEFLFESNDKTYIQYMVSTTQLNNLPAHRRKYNYPNDNIGDYFEEYEISGSFAKYRVMRRDLPTEYSITSILTGYYKSGKWFWKSNFRPVYEF